MSFLAKFESLPYFTKKDLISVFLRSHYALDDRIKRLLNDTRLLQLKNGIYMTSNFYFNEPDKAKLVEFISSKLCYPSYLSLGYGLKKYNLLNSSPEFVTCITTKTTRLFKNFLGFFKYSNVKPLLFSGFKKIFYRDYEYFIATKAKALFDYLYLKPNLKGKIKYLRQQLFEGLGINWTNFSEQDFKEFDQNDENLAYYQ